jgi:carbonic anhydrase
MKKTSKLSIFFTILLLSTTFLATAQKSQTWDFPIKPGMEEWAKFQSRQEIVDACQIPENTLRTLSTEELTDIIVKLDEQYRKHIRFTSFGPDNESRVFINQLSYELIK